MRMLFLILLSTSLFATDSPFDVDVSNGGEPSGLSNPLQPHPEAINNTASHNSGYFPKVNVITGAYVEEECDLVVAGCEPISLRRFYCSNAPINLAYGRWSVNPECYVYADPDYSLTDHHFIAAGDSDGSMTLFENRHVGNIFSFDISRRKGHMNIGSGLPSGQKDILNTYINYQKKHDTKNEKRFYISGTIRDGSNRKRYFKSHMHAWYESWHKGGCYLNPERWLPASCLVKREERPNGNIIYYEYDRTFDDKSEPSLYVIKKITAKSKSGKTLGYIDLKYFKSKLKLPEQISAQGSDGREVKMETSPKYRKRLINFKPPKIEFIDNFLRSVETPNKHKVFYSYAGFEKAIDLVEGKGVDFRTIYYKNEKYSLAYKRVFQQSAPVGPDGRSKVIATYFYENNLTKVKNPYENFTIYHFNDEKRITQIEKTHRKTTYHRQHFVWSSQGRLTCNFVQDGNQQTHSATTYTYDKRGNVLQEKLWGNLTGNLQAPFSVKKGIPKNTECYTITRTYSNEVFNLVLSETDGSGKTKRYTYLPETNLVERELVYENDSIRKRAFYFYDDCAVCIRKIVDDGCSKNPDDLTGITQRLITVVQPKQTLPCFGLPEIIEQRSLDESGNEILLQKVIYTYTPFGKVAQEDHYDATDTHRYSIKNTYNKKEQLASTTDPLGNITHKEYDTALNLIRETGPLPGMEKIWTYDRANRPIQTEEKQTDGSYLKTEMRYDALSNPTYVEDACGNRTNYKYDPSGRLINTVFPSKQWKDGDFYFPRESREYDLFDRVIKLVDAEGGITHTDYNVRGKPIKITHPDRSIETCEYNLDGTLHSQTDISGITTVYTYDIFHHPIKTETYAPDGTLLKEISATYSPFQQLSVIDEEGITTFYTYDLAGRKTSEKNLNREVFYFYDELGNVTVTQEGDTLSIKEYDVMGNIIESRTEDASGKLYTKEAYRYDALGNKTHTISYRDETTPLIEETVYNTRKQPIALIDADGNVTSISFSYEGIYTKTTTDPLGTQVIETYDAFNHPTSIIKKDPQGNILQKREMIHDTKGNQLRVIETVFEGALEKETIIHKMRYDSMGRITRLVEDATNKKKTTRYTYDASGRLKTLQKPSGVILEHDYDLLGREVSLKAPDLHYTYAYDKCDRLIQIIDHIHNLSTLRTYDGYGNMLSETLGNGLCLQNAYDIQCRRSQILLPDNSSIRYTYNSAFLETVNRFDSSQNYLYRHTYAKRTLEGLLTEAILPLDSGRTSITWDRLGRWKSFQGPGFTEHFDEDAYDPIGNLHHYTFTDMDGLHNAHFTYDALYQLSSEEGHSYTHDSLHNRTSKDDNTYTVNTLCQVTSDGENQYTYDPNGNLISDPEKTYTYDSLDRLIAVQTKTHTYRYIYDSFNRRISKHIISTTSSQQIDYLWDGECEIGASQNNHITELRLLGEGLGGEIASAVAHEINGEVTVPLFDHRGCLATLLSHKQPIEAYRFTSFGEEKTDSSHSPWRFSSKRHDSETGFTYFGKRYYHPTLGRWLTPDPSGFTDGPNLYAYLNNCPLIDCDLYGLFSLSNLLLPKFNPMGVQGNFQNPFGIGQPHNYQHFEDRFANKSFNYSLNDFNYGFRELPVGRVCFGNGVGNTFEDAWEKAWKISELAGRINIYGTYNATHKIRVDTHEALMNLAGHTLTTPIFCYHQQWDSYFSKDTSGAPLLQKCHSQGAAQVRNALETYSKERRERIIVAAFAPFAFISKDLCMEVTHYVCDSDPVTYFDLLGRINNRKNTVHIKRNPSINQSCHEFLNPIYEAYIEHEIDQYKRLLRDYVN